jgi:hypothetical protein
MSDRTHIKLDADGNFRIRPDEKPVTREEMIAYLAGHERYFTMSSVNRSHSYGVNVKVSGLPVRNKTEQNKMYELLDVEDAFDQCGVTNLLHMFAIRHDGRWQIGFNGRSGGYMVLYQGERKPSQHKSYCVSCGQRNFTLATDENKRCGRCGKDTRRNYDKPLMELSTWPGRGTDEDRDYEDWDDDSLRSRVDVVWDFDETVENCLNDFRDCAVSNEVVEETVMVPHTVKRLRSDD